MPDVTRCLTLQQHGFESNPHTNRCDTEEKVKSTARSTDYKVNDFAFADDIILLENDSIHAQRQLDSFKTEAGKVGLEINVQKTEQMRLNKLANLSIVNVLVINDQPINIVDDFKSCSITSNKTKLFTNIEIVRAIFDFLVKNITIQIKHCHKTYSKMAAKQ